MNWQALAISALATLLPALLMLLFPFWQRTFFFTVRVPDGFPVSEDGRRIARAFRLAVLASGLACGLTMYWGAVNRVGWVAAPAPILNGVLLIALLLVARQRTLPFAAPAAGTVRRAVLAGDGDGQPWWMAASVIGGLAMLAAAAAFVSIHWPELPERFPVHWGLDGEPNRWANKSAFGIYGPLLIGLAVQAKMAFILFALAEAGSPISRRRRLNQAVIALVNLAAASLLAVVMLFPLRDTAAGLPGPTWAWLCTPLLFAIPTIWVAWRLQHCEDEEVEPTLDRNWWGGLIYSNAADARMMVPNRIGPGYTFNLGNPVVRIVLPLLILWVLGTVVAIPLLGQVPPAAQAREAAADFARRDFAALYDRGSPAFREAVTKPDFDVKLDAAAEALGTCAAPAAEPTVQGNSFLFPLECAKQTVGLNVVLDGAGAMQGSFCGRRRPNAQPNRTSPWSPASSSSRRV